jgi:hypothetical protein
VNSLIDLIKNGGNGFAPLETERKLYIEYSNEVWNGMFDQAVWNHDQAVAEVNSGGSPLNFDGETNDYYWSWRRVGKRIVEISNQFRDAFGDAQMMTRFRPVLAWQQNNGQATASNQLDFIQKYYGTSQWGYADPHLVNYYLWGGGGALYYHKKPVAEDTEWQETVITDSKYASAYGIHYCNYEGAMYFDSDTDTDWDSAWVTQRMLDRQQFYEEHGGHLFMFFTLAATWENGLGHVRTIRDLNTPKYNGIVQLSQQAQGWSNTYGAILPMHSDGGQFSLIGGDWESPHAGATNLSPRAWRAYHFDVDDTGKYKVWIEYRSTEPIDLNIYAGSELVATITNNTNGNPSVSPQYLFNSTAGLKAIRIENLGGAPFEIISVNAEISSTMVEDADLNDYPVRFSLLQNYPNPFNPVTRIKYQLPEDSYVTLRVFDILGNQVAELVNGYQSAGNHAVSFPANNLKLVSGTYFYELQAGDFVSVKKMLLIK